MNLSEWADFKREAYRTDGQWASPEDDAKIFGSAYDAIKANQNVDWVDVLMQTGSQMSHSIKSRMVQRRQHSIWPLNICLKTVW